MAAINAPRTKRAIAALTGPHCGRPDME